MGKGRKSEPIGRITKKDGDMMKAIARTGVISKANAVHFLGQNDKRLRLLEKNGYLRVENVFTKSGGQTIYKLGSTGRTYISEQTNISQLYRSNNTQLMHDLQLNNAYFQISETARDSWLNESQVKSIFGNLIKEAGIEKGGIDAVVYVDGQPIGIEVITNNYSQIEIDQKIEIGKIIGCEGMRMIKC